MFEGESGGGFLGRLARWVCTRLYQRCFHLGIGSPSYAPVLVIAALDTILAVTTLISTIPCLLLAPLMLHLVTVALLAAALVVLVICHRS